MFSALDRLLVYVHYSVQSRKKWGVNLLQTEKSIGRSCKVKLGTLTIYRSNTVHCSVCNSCITQCTITCMYVFIAVWGPCGVGWSDLALFRFSKSNTFLPNKCPSGIFLGAQFQKIGQIGRARGKFLFLYYFYIFFLLFFLLSKITGTLKI